MKRSSQSSALEPGRLYVDAPAASLGTDGLLKLIAGRVGTEGPSTGPHSHFQVNVNGRSLDLYRWLEAAQPGIVTKGDVADRPHFSFAWQADIAAMGNAEERIIVERVDGGNGENIAYAWLADGTRGERVVWKTVQYEGESEAKFRWVKAANEAEEWDPVEQIFELRVLAQG